MKKTILFVFLWMSISAFAQKEFQPGYFINNDGKKVECLINNENWFKNPTTFQYKQNEQGAIQTRNISNTQAFSITGKVKFVRAFVDIDRSTDRIGKLSTTRKTTPVQETLFLKIVVEGEAAKLYSYVSQDFKRFFFSKSDGKVTPLIYKRYKNASGQVSSNDLYKKQLRDFLPCEKIKSDPSYSTNSLRKYFVAYNTCSNENTDVVDYGKIKPKGIFKINAKAGASFVSGSFNDVSKQAIAFIDEELNSTAVPRIGLEFEYLFPNKEHHLSTFINFNYEFSYAQKVEIRLNTLASPRDFDYEIDYSRFEVQIGFRKYFYLNSKSRLFLDASYGLDVPMGSSFTIETLGLNLTDDVEVSPSLAYQIGGGVSFDPFRIELRYGRSNDMLQNTTLTEANLNFLALQFVYTFFDSRK
jgi:hypothetical protein